VFKEQNHHPDYQRKNRASPLAETDPNTNLSAATYPKPEPEPIYLVYQVPVVVYPEPVDFIDLAEAKTARAAVDITKAEVA